MVKADGGFDLVVIDLYGRTLALEAYPQGGEAMLVADVHFGNGKGTLNTQLSDWRRK